MRVGVYGGSFDPPHVGHLVLAADAVKNLELDELLFIPAHFQPFKPGKEGASPAARAAMVRLAIRGSRLLRLETLEIERGGLSYTVDTLEELSRRTAGAELFLIVGEDALGDFEKWRNPGRIRELARVAVLRRRPDTVPRAVPDGVLEASRRLVDVSSTEIRSRVKEGSSIRGFVTEAVENYIETNALYR